MQSIRDFLQKRLKLKVSELKIQRGSTVETKILRVQHVQEQNPGAYLPSKPVSMEDQAMRLNAYLGRRVGCFALADTPNVFQSIEGWLRRRLCM